MICEKCGQQNDKNNKLCRSCGTPLYKNYYRGLWFRNMVVTFALFIVPLVIVFYILNFEVTSSFEHQIQTSLDYSVNVNARIIRLFLEERQKDLLSIADFDGMTLTEAGSRVNYFKRFIRNKPEFDLLVVADTTGTIVMATDDIHGSIKTRTYFKHSLRGEFYNSGIFYSDILDTTAMVISSPFRNRAGRIIGVILANISLKNLYNLILYLRIGKTSEIFLVDENGYFLSPSKLGGDVLTQVAYSKGDPNPHTGSNGLLMHRDYRGEKVICAYKKNPDLRWYLISEMDVNEALAPVNALKNIMLLTFVIVGLFLIGSSIVFSRQVTSMLKNLTASLKTALDDSGVKKEMINTINIELRKRLKECQNLSTKLNLSEVNLKNIANSIASGLIAVNREYRITYCNNAAREILHTAYDLLDKNLFEAGTVFSDQTIKKAIEDLFNKGASFRLDRKNVENEGVYMTLTIAGFPVQTVDGLNTATLLLIDISDLELMNAQMADYEKLSALSQLALGAAHEINNPLQGVTSYLEMLRDEETDVENKTRTQAVLDNAYRISETIRGLLNFARPTPPSFTKINLNKLIIETISFLKHQPLFKKLKIEKNLSEALPTVTADANQIRQVLINILLNAAQATPEGGMITVNTAKVKFEEFVEVTITDTGVGIKEEDLKKVFDPFFTTKKGTGTGLGLSISLSYIKNHNGDIHISSIVGKGTTVSIVIPVRQKGRVQGEVIE
jgi:signal transduction histidine kinase